LALDHAHIFFENKQESHTCFFENKHVWHLTLNMEENKFLQIQSEKTSRQPFFLGLKQEREGLLSDQPSS
jgi:hypothetical protein